MKRITRAMSPAALVVSVLALVLTAGLGSAYAVSKVSTHQIKNGAVTSAKLHTGAVTAPKLAAGAVGSSAVKDGSLSLADLAPSLVAKLPSPLTWAPIPLNTGWTDTESFYSTNPATYAKDPFGIVHLQGGVRNAGHTGGIIGTLPVGYRPAKEVYAIAWGYNAQSPSFVKIGHDGTITAYATIGGTVPNNAQDFTSLESITFTAGG